MPLILFGGFIANTASTPAWLGWIQWTSPIRYGNEALAHTQYDSIKVGLAQEYLILEGFTLGYWNCVWACLGWAIFWRVMSYIMITCNISKFQ